MALGKPVVAPAMPPEPNNLGDSPLSVAVSRYWWFIALCAAVVAVAAVAYAGLRPQTYTAQTELVVGRADIQTQSLPSYVEGAQNLAGTYSRLVSTPQVLAPVARQEGTSVESVASRVSATPIPNSGLFRISAQGSSAASALRTLGLVVTQAHSFLDSLDKDQTTAVAAFNRYRRVIQNAAKLTRQLKQARAAGASPATVTGLIGRQKATLLVANTAAQQYQQALMQSSRAVSGVQVLTPASHASSNRSSDMRLFGFSGAAAGALLGLALALARVRRRVLRPQG